MTSGLNVVHFLELMLIAETAPFNGAMSHEHGERSTRDLGISPQAAASTLGVSQSTIDHWADMGYLDSHRTPTGQRRFSQDQIDLLVSQLQSQHAEPRRNYKTG